MEDFEPSIIAFVCNWCTYTAADLAGRFGIDIRQPEFWKTSMGIIESRIFRPTAPSNAARECAIDRNKNGSASTIVSGTIELIGAKLTRVRSRPPNTAISSVSFSAPI